VIVGDTQVPAAENWKHPASRSRTLRRETVSGVQIHPRAPILQSVFDGRCGLNWLRKSLAKSTRSGTVRRIPVLAVLIASCSAVVLPQSPDARAQASQILDQARAALGGGAALDAIHSLSAAGDFRVGSGDSEVSGTVKVDSLFPDKFIRTMKWSRFQTENVTTVEAMNGGQAWADSQMQQAGMGMGSLGGVGAGRGSRRGGMGGGGGGGRRGGGSEGNPGKYELAPDLQDGLDSQNMRSYFSGLMTALLLRLSDSAPDGISYEGKVDVNGVKCDSLKIKSGVDPAISLAIDEKTHRPVMVIYQAALPRRPEGGRSGRPTVRKNNPSAAGESQESHEPQLARVEIFFSEYKTVEEKKFGNIWLPFQITRTSDGQTVEDMHFKTFQLNPHLTPKQFEQKR